MESDQCNDKQYNKKKKATAHSKLEKQHNATTKLNDNKQTPRIEYENKSKKRYQIPFDYYTLITMSWFDFHFVLKTYGIEINSRLKM